MNRLTFPSASLIGAPVCSSPLRLNRMLEDPAAATETYDTSPVMPGRPFSPRMYPFSTICAEEVQSGTSPERVSRSAALAVWL